jgi:hypothetical protein
MDDVSLRLLALLLVLASVYALSSARPRVGNVFQQWDLTPGQARVIGASGLVVACGLFAYSLL